MNIVIRASLLLRRTAADFVGFLKGDVNQRAFEAYLNEAQSHAELEQRERNWAQRGPHALRELAVGIPA